MLCYALVTEITGFCTFENSGVQACSIVGPSDHFTTYSDIESMHQCKKKCKNSNPQADKKCWAVNFIHSDEYELCFLFWSADPFRFDKNGPYYQSPCTSYVHDEDDTVKIAWKRCSVGTTASATTSSSGSFSPRLTTDVSTNAINGEVSSQTVTSDVSPQKVIVKTTDTTVEQETETPSTTLPPSETPPTTLPPSETPSTTLPPSESMSSAFTHMSNTKSSSNESSSSQVPVTERISQTFNPVTEKKMSSAFVTFPTGHNSVSTVSTELTTEAPFERQCSCVCDKNTVLFPDVTSKSLMEDLKIDKTKTSLYLRKRASAYDGRPSAKGIGLFLGVGVLVTTASIIILSDLVTFVKWLKT